MNLMCYIYIESLSPWTVTKCKSNLFSVKCSDQTAKVKVEYLCTFTVQEVVASDLTLVIFRYLLTIKVDPFKYHVRLQCMLVKAEHQSTALSNLFSAEQ